jgi:transposase
MFYAVLDVWLRLVAICTIDVDGTVRLERSVPSDVPDLVRCLNKFEEPIHQVRSEADTLTQHLTYGLRKAGFDVVCMEARQVAAALAALAAMRHEKDKYDACSIAKILRSGGTAGCM